MPLSDLPGPAKYLLGFSQPDIPYQMDHGVGCDERRLHSPIPPSSPLNWHDGPVRRRLEFLYLERRDTALSILLHNRPNAPPELHHEDLRIMHPEWNP